MELKDRIAIVTGGGGGIGEGICLCLAKEGADIVVSDVDEKLAQNVAAKVEEMGRRSLAVRTDVRDEAECKSLVETALDKMGRLDILACSAGVSAASLMNAPEDPMAVENIPIEAWDWTIDVNQKGVFLCNRAVLPHFKKQLSGKIVNISSAAGRNGSALLPVYAASKAGVISLTQSVALQAAQYNINVNSICPGLIYTPLWAEGIERTLARMKETQPAIANVTPEMAFNGMVQESTPLKRAQTAEDIGNMAAFLVSERAKEITGQAFNVDGGMNLN